MKDILADFEAIADGGEKRQAGKYTEGNLTACERSHSPGIAEAKTSNRMGCAARALVGAVLIATAPASPAFAQTVEPTQIWTDPLGLFALDTAGWATATERDRVRGETLHVNRREHGSPNVQCRSTEEPIATTGAVQQLASAQVERLDTAQLTEMFPTDVSDVSHQRYGDIAVVALTQTSGEITFHWRLFILITPSAAVATTIACGGPSAEFTDADRVAIRAFLNSLRFVQETTP